MKLEKFNDFNMDLEHFDPMYNIDHNILHILIHNKHFKKRLDPF